MHLLEGRLRSLCYAYVWVVVVGVFFWRRLVARVEEDWYGGFGVFSLLDLIHPP